MQVLVAPRETVLLKNLIDFVFQVPAYTRAHISRRRLEQESEINEPVLRLWFFVCNCEIYLKLSRNRESSTA